MLQDVKHNINEAPLAVDAMGSNSAQKKYYSADEAVAFLEPRIRAMF